MSADLDCIFCAIVAGRAEGSLVHQDDLIIAFMDTMPVTRGHLLVVPLDHHELVGEMPEGLLGKVMEVGRQLGTRLRKTLGSEGISFHLADGIAAGQEVAHVHLHLIPRNPGDGFGFRFPAGYGTQPYRGELDAIAESLRGD